MASAPNDSSTSGYATEKIGPPVSRSYKPRPHGNDRSLLHLGMRGVPLADAQATSRSNRSVTPSTRFLEMTGIDLSASTVG